MVKTASKHMLKSLFESSLNVFIFWRAGCNKQVAEIKHNNLVILMSFWIRGAQIPTEAELILKKKKVAEYPDEAPSLTRGLVVLESNFGGKKS